MSEANASTRRSRYKLVMIELVPGDDSFELNPAALETVAKRVEQVFDQINGVQIVASSEPRDQPLIDPDMERDYEAEARVTDRVRDSTAAIVEEARARDHLRRAGEELGEATLLGIAAAHVKAEYRLRQSLSAAAELWEDCVPGAPEICKSIIKNAVWVGIVYMCVNLAT